MSTYQVEAASFSDTEGHWSAPYVEKFFELGYVNGYEDGTFKPQNPITRAEFVKLVNRAFELEEKVGKIPFTDLDREWKVEELKIALAANYITPAPEFRHNEPINRQEAAKIVGTLLILSDDLIFNFIDENEIAPWATDHVQGLVKEGILSRNEMFRPKDSITRAEALKILFLATQPSIKAETIELTQTSVSISVGDSIGVRATVKPGNTTNKQVNWRSENPEVAVVDRNGTIQGVSAGTTTILVSADSNASIEREVLVEVKEVLAESIHISQSAVNLELGGNAQVSAWVSPDNTTNKGITWSSENNSVATVDENGTITAKGAGDKRIVATAVSNGSAKVYIEVKVKEKPDPTPSVVRGDSVVSQLLNEGFYSGSGGAFWSPEGPDVATDFQDVYAVAYNGGLSLQVAVAGYYGDESYSKVQHVLSKILPNGASTVVGYIKNGQAGTYTIDGRRVTVSYGSKAFVYID